MLQEKELDEGSSIIFINRSWFSNKKQPKYKGKLKLDGKEYAIDLWELKSSKSTVSFLSGKVTEINEYRNNIRSFVKDKNTEAERKFEDENIK